MTTEATPWALGSNDQLGQVPERMGLDAIRQAIDDRDAMEMKYHDLAEHMVYHGNSVSWWHSKATAYRDAIDRVWDELKAAGIVCDGRKTCADGVRELALELSEEKALRHRLLNAGPNVRIIGCTQSGA